jgi:PAS domain S-box-containing protein
VPDLTPESRGESASAELDAEQVIRALEARERFLTGILGSLESFFTVDAQWRCTFANEAGVELAGVSEEELLGRDVREFLLNDVREEVCAQFDVAMRERSVVALRSVDSRAAPRILEALASPLADGGLAIYVRDVTRQERADAATLEAEQRYEQLVESVNSAIVRWSRDGTTTFFNSCAERLFGWRADEVLGRPVNFLLPDPEGDGEDLSGLAEDIVAHPERYASNVNENVRKDGSRLWMAWTNRALVDERGEVTEVLVVGNDVTELVTAQEALRESAGRLRIAQEATGLGVQDYDPQTGEVLWDERVRELWGVGPDEHVTFETFEAGVHPDDREAVAAAVAAAMDPRSEGRHEIDYRVVNRVDGLERWVHATWRVFFEQERPVRMVGTVQDITGRKQLEEARERQAELLDLSFDAIIVWQLGGTIESWNRGAEKLYGFSEGEALGQVTHDLLSTIHQRPWPQIAAALREHGSWEGEIRHRAKDGREVVVSSRLQLIRSGDGVERVLETNRDITEHKLAEAERELLLDAAAVLTESILLPDVLDRLTKIILDVGGHSRVVVSLWQESPKQLIVARSRGEAALVDGMIVEIDDLSAPARRAIEEQETLVIDYDALEPGRRGMGDRYTSHLALDVPLVFGGRFVGLLATDDPGERREFTDRQIRLIEGIAAHATVAIGNARIYELEIATKIEQAAQKERSRLAGDLHDSVTQALFAASLKAEALAVDQESLPDGTVKVAEDVRRLSRGALAQMRTLLLELRGDPLEDVPIAQLLRHLVEATQGRTSVDVQLTMRGDAPLAPALHVAIYRVAQEALNNVARHAGASKAWVDLDMEPGDVHLLVGDDGRGYEPSDFDPSHLGLRLMRERAEEAGAELSIVTELGGGTVVTLDWQRD